MPQYKIEHLTLHKDPYERVMTEDQFAEWCVKMEGGGFTQVQTKRAMALQALAHGRGEAHIRGFRITRLPDVGPPATIAPMNSQSVQQDVQS